MKLVDELFTQTDMLWEHTSVPATCCRNSNHLNSCNKTLGQNFVPSTNFFLSVFGRICPWGMSLQHFCGIWFPACPRRQRPKATKLFNETTEESIQVNGRLSNYLNEWLQLKPQRHNRHRQRFPMIIVLEIMPTITVSSVPVFVEPNFYL